MFSPKLVKKNKTKHRSKDLKNPKENSQREPIIKLKTSDKEKNIETARGG